MPFNLIICPGIHQNQWTCDFINSFNLDNFKLKNEQIFIIPTDLYAPYDGKKIYQFILDNYPQKNPTNPLIFISFSAGVVGALIASRLWQRQGGKVFGLIAVDGWGVPLIADFPIYTLSHDYFTHATLIKFNHHIDSFYAYPSVSHEQIWRSPLQTSGYWQRANGIKHQSNAVEMIKFCLEKYQQM